MVQEQPTYPAIFRADQARPGHVYGHTKGTGKGTGLTHSPVRFQARRAAGMTARGRRAR